MVRKLTVLAIGLIVLGAVAMAGPTLGFSTVASDRGVQVSAVDGEGAYLGMTSANSDGDVIINDDEEPTTVFTLYNNLESDMDLDNIEISITGDGGELTDNPDLPSNINSGEEETVDVACEEIAGGNDNDGGTATITLTIEEADGGQVTITETSIEDGFEYNCHQGGDGDGDGNQGCESSGNANPCN